MQLRCKFSGCLLLLALPLVSGTWSCGGEAQETGAASSEPTGAASAGQGDADTNRSTGPQSAGDAAGAASDTSDLWRTKWRSDIIDELPPPDDDAFLERAALDRQRLTEILEEDLATERFRVRSLQRRLSLVPDDAELRFELAEFYFVQDLPNLAELELLNVLELEPEHPVAHQYLADIYLQAGNQGRSIYHARRAHAAEPRDPANLYLWAWTLRDGGDPETSLAVAEAGLALAPNDAELLAVRALLAMDAGDDAAAEGFARRAVEAEPDHVRAHSLLGLALSNLGRDAEAEAELQIHRRLQLLRTAGMLGVDPPIPEWRRAAALVTYHMHVGNLAEAHAELARSFELKPDNPAALTMRARLDFKAGDEASAIAGLEAALERHPGDPQLERALASMLIVTADRELRDAERAAQLAGGLLGRGGAGDFEVLYTLGLAEAELGLDVMARMHLRQALEIDATNKDVRAALDAFTDDPEE